MILDEETGSLSVVSVEERDYSANLFFYAGVKARVAIQLIYQSMREYCEDFKGGFWGMSTVSNGTFYMTPPDTGQPYKMTGRYNYYNGNMSADAAGIVSSLLGLNRLACVTEEDEHIELYYRLRDLAIHHPESTEILAAID